LITAAETMPDGLLITDLSGIILYANPRVAQVLRVGENELLGENVTSFLPIDTRKVMVDAYTQALLERGSLEIEFELEIAGGEKHPLSVRASLVYDPQHTPRQVVISVSDITSHKQHEHQLLALNQLITDLVQHRSKEELLPVVFAAAEELLGAQSSGIYLAGADGKITELMTHNLSEAYAQRVAQGYGGLPGETVLNTRKPVCVKDVMNDPVYQERLHFVAEYGLRAMLLLPILFEDNINGVLVVYHDRAHNFTDEEVQLGMTLAHTVAIALQNLYLYQAEHSQRQLAETLVQAAASLNRLLNPDEVLDQILEQAIHITACRSTNILLVEGENARLVRRKGYAETPIYPTEYENFSLPITAPTIHAMLESGEPLLISNTLHDEHWSTVPRTDWIRSYAGAPLKISGEVIGFLSVDSDQPDIFNQDTIRRLQALADHASIAIHNAELYSESRRQAQELSTLVQSAATVSSSLDFNQVLELLSKQMARMVGVEGCAISVYNQADLTVKVLAFYMELTIHHHSSWFDTFSLHDYPLTRRVLQENITIQLHSDDPQADPAELALMRDAGVKTLLMLPLVVRDETLGLVEIESVEPGRVFTQREIALLETLGVYAANAIQNARLYSQLQEYAGLLERRVEDRTTELRSAKDISKAFWLYPDALFVLDENYLPIRAGWRRVDLTGTI
jgi:PAS domain S-box-containing protein